MTGLRAYLYRGYSGFKLLVTITISISLAACGSTEENVALLAGGVFGATLLGARAPSHEIQQTYYLGVFDPQSQVEPTVYRVRLHGQASFISGVQFASGWLPSIAVDSLGTRVEWDEGKKTASIVRADKDDANNTFQTGRRLVMFGPEGFREAPADHRLVVAMGTDPQAYFEAVNGALEVVATVTQTPVEDPGAVEFKDKLLRLRTMLSKDKNAITAVQLKRAETAR